MRQIPFDQQAERATLGAILLDREAIIAVAALLTPEQFYLEKHGWVYEAALTCYNRRVPPDIATIADELRRRERLESVGGIAFLGELVAAVSTAVHIAYYAEIVECTAVRRRLIETGGKIAALGYAEQDDLQATLDQAESALFAVSDQRTTNTVYSLGSEVKDLFRAMTYQQEHRGLERPPVASADDQAAAPDDSRWSRIPGTGKGCKGGIDSLSQSPLPSASRT